MKLDALTQNIASEKMSASASPDSSPLKANVIENQGREKGNALHHYRIALWVNLNSNVLFVDVA